jgi:hypothetical protein
LVAMSLSFSRPVFFGSKITSVNLLPALIYIVPHPRSLSVSGSVLLPINDPLRVTYVSGLPVPHRHTTVCHRKAPQNERGPHGRSESVPDP